RVCVIKRENSSNICGAISRTDPLMLIVLYMVTPPPLVAPPAARGSIRPVNIGTNTSGPRSPTRYGCPPVTGPPPWRVCSGGVPPRDPRRKKPAAHLVKKHVDAPLNPGAGIGDPAAAARARARDDHALELLKRFRLLVHCPEKGGSGFLRRLRLRDAGLGGGLSDHGEGRHRLVREFRIRVAL